MAVTTSNYTNAFGKNFSGLSTDTKPTSATPDANGNYAAINDLFLELDTGDFYFYDGSDWLKVGYAAQ